MNTQRRDPTINRHTFFVYRDIPYALFVAIENAARPLAAISGGEMHISSIAASLHCVVMHGTEVVYSL